MRQTNGTTVYVGDVAHVRDGYAVQTNIVRHNGARAALLTVLKNGGSSTLDIVDKLKAMLPRIRSTLPSSLNLSLMFDQSIFVRAAIAGVLREAVIAAVLTGLMILLFLGSWRSTIIVCVSIPLSILTSLAVLNLLGETINVMTLGGLALAVGILVDDATVEIENIHRNFGLGKPILRAILEGAMQIAIPAFVSTLCICIVFVPVIFLTGAARYLFTPLALAVVLAMMASYLLSRTLVPTMVRYLLAGEAARYHGEEGALEDEQPRPLRRHSSRLPSLVRRRPRRLPQPARVRARAPRRRRRRVLPDLRSLPRAHPLPRPGLLSAGRCRPDPPPRPRRPPAPASRRPSATSPTSRTPSAASSRATS